jgi:hypothetical protein
MSTPLVCYAVLSDAVLHCQLASCYSVPCDVVMYCICHWRTELQVPCHLWQFKVCSVTILMSNFLFMSNSGEWRHITEGNKL